MHFLRSVKGYTRRDKIRSEVIGKELEISGIQDVRSKHKQNWINHLERMDNTRLPKHKGHTRRDKIRNGVIRKKLEISGIQDVSSKHKIKLDQPS
jgi:hypothetical protein